VKSQVKVKPRKTAELVADHLRSEIITGTLAAGDTLAVERELLETYGVSRPTLREALRILETEGLLEVTRGMKGGAKILGPSLTLATHAFGMFLQAQGTKLVDVQVARSIIEPPAVRMVAERRSTDDIAVLRSAADAERAVAGTPEFPFAAMRFHEILIGLSGNRTVSAFLQVLHEIHHGAAVMFSKGQPRHHSRIVSQHDELISCIERGDGPAAEALWRRYWAPFTEDRGTAVVDVLNARR
jgi:DNA-binding FadR family transcriptional regulator